MQSLFQDLRFAIRTLTKSPGFTAVAVLTLALGIGATTTIFSCVNALLLRPLPYPNQERLVAVFQTAPKKGWDKNNLSDADFLDYRAQNRSFEELGMSFNRSFSLTTGENATFVDGEVITTNMFKLLGVAPILGRTFLPVEEQPGKEPVMIISHRMWRDRFQGDPKILGRTVTLSALPRTIVGVMPPGFLFPENSDVWLPFVIDPAKVSRGNHSYEGIGLLKPGASVASARAEMDAIGRGLAKQYPETNAETGANVLSYRDELVDSDVQVILGIFLGAVGFVLLIACANVANLLLARASVRQKEIAIRTALGAGRFRVVRQLLTEGVLIALLGGALGALMASWGLDLIVAAIPEEMPFWMKFTIDPTVLMFTTLISVATGVIFSLAPAVQLSNPALNETLKEGGRGSSVGARRNKLRNVLVAGEVALSLVLLIGATLMIRSFLGVQKASSGFDPERVLTMRVPLLGTRYDSLSSRPPFWALALEKVRAIPQVEAVGLVNNIPLGGSNSGSNYSVEGEVITPGSEPGADFKSIAGDYFTAMRIPLRRGRNFTPQETVDTALHVAIVSQALADRHWPQQDPLGKRLRFGADSTNPWMSVVGVVAGTNQRKVGDKPESQIYVPYASSSWRTMTLAIKTKGEPGALAPAVRDAISSVDRTIPTFAVYSMREIIRRSESVWLPRLYGWLFGVFALIALLLAAVGVYGVMAYSVSQRTHEIGIRMALGAQRDDVLRLVVRQGAVLTVIGLVVGLPLAFALTRLLASFLFGVSASDPLTFFGIAGMLAVIGSLAAYMPARRATRVDPVVALRSE
jgi:putative ABC transport system permease protein